MTTVAIIPARMASSRFPGKPLAKILGKAMLEHVYRRARLCRALDGVYVATCDEVIRDAVESWGGKAVMTSERHERGTERIAEAAATLGLTDRDIAVNVQGDEPMLHPDMIDLALGPLARDPAVACTNLIAPINSDEEHRDPNEIKVVQDRAGRALYMSRAAVPSDTRGLGDVPRFKQVCVIGFRYPVLQRFVALEPTALERAESIDMMRLIENGVAVTLVPSPFPTQAVDTPAGLKLVETLMTRDPLLARYATS